MTCEKCDDKITSDPDFEFPKICPLNGKRCPLAVVNKIFYKPEDNEDDGDCDA